MSGKCCYSTKSIGYYLIFGVLIMHSLICPILIARKR